MAGKAPVFCSKPLDFAMQALSKNQLIDLVVDLARGQFGEDASDDVILAWVQDRMEVVWRYRGDREVSLASRHAQFTRASEKYQAGV